MAPASQPAALEPPVDAVPAPSPSGAGEVVLPFPHFDARFGEAGVSIVPRGGSGSAGWSWGLRKVEAGGAPVPGVDLVGVAPELGAPGVVEYRRGGLTELYVARRATVEQLFVLPVPLGSPGEDLVISGWVEGASRFGETQGGWGWGAGSAAVTLGDVTVLDARGRELAAELEVSAEATRLRIDGESLSTAAYPVTIDPQIGVEDFRISDMGPEGEVFFWAFVPAVAHDPIAGQYLVVWAGKDVSTVEDEIYGQRLDAATGAEIGENDLRISDMGPDGGSSYDAEDPAVAYNPLGDEFLVVWSGDDGPGPDDNDLEVYGQRIDASTGAEIGENDFRISDMGSEDDGDTFDVQLTYNWQANEYLVVWAGFEEFTELEIYGQRIDASTGAEVGENDFRISDMGLDGDITLDAESPAIVYNMSRHEYLVVWAGEDVVQNELEIYGQRLDGSTGAEIGENDFRISRMNDGADHVVEALTPAVAWARDRDEYLVVWEAERHDLDRNPQIYGQRLDGVTGAPIGLPVRVSDMGPPDGSCETNIGASGPRVAYSEADGEYVVVWQGVDECALGSGESEIHAQRIDAATGEEAGANDYRLSSVGEDGDPVRDAFDPAIAVDPASGEVLVVWWGDELANEDFEIHGQRYAPGLFEDDFDDEAIDPAWSLPRGVWTEELGRLWGGIGAVGDAPMAGGLATGFAGCGECTVRAELSLEEPTGEPEVQAVWLAGWSRGPATQVLVVLRPGLDRVLLGQRLDGALLASSSAAAPLEPGVTYELALSFDGERFRLALDGGVILEQPSAFPGEPFGTVGFGARGGRVAVEEVSAEVIPGQEAGPSVADGLDPFSRR